MKHQTIASIAGSRVLNRYHLLYNTLLVATGSLVIAALAQLEILLPFSPVPITAQTFAVLAVGMALGSTRGALAVLAYLLEGSAGLPVFAGGAAGFVYLFGPTGGYLIGFLPAAYLVGWLAERGWDKRLWSAILGMIAGTVIIFAFGLGWLANFIPGNTLLTMGLYPFLPGAAIKVMLAAALLPAIRRFI